MARAGAEIRESVAAAAKVIETPLGPRKLVKCVCGHQVFDGIVIRSRVIRVLPRGGAEALCRCKRWQRLPFTYDAGALDNSG